MIIGFPSSPGIRPEAAGCELVEEADWPRGSAAHAVRPDPGGFVFVAGWKMCRDGGTVFVAVN